MNMRRVLITSTSFQDTPGDHHAFLESMEWEVDFLRGPLKESEIAQHIANYDGVICGDDEYTKNVIKIGVKGKLKVLSKYGVGLDKIDIIAANEFGLKVTNCPSVNFVSVAEHALSLLFTYAKNIHHQYNSVQRGRWYRMIGNEISGKTIGIIGLGSVGKEMAKKSLALGLKVIAYDIRTDQDFKNFFSEINYANDLDKIFFESDIISLHTPLNEKTKYLINDEVVQNKLRKKPIILNTARGALVDSKSIISGLNSKKIKAYLTDVLENEPIKKDDILLNNDNIIITPHIGSRTYENVSKQALFSIKNLAKHLS